MATPILVSNTLRVEECPFCESTAVRAVGRITYSSHLTFGSIPVELQVPPELARCAACGSGFTQYAISESDAFNLYRQGDSSARWLYRPLEQDKTDRFLRTLHVHCQPGTSVLDVGCNDGALLDYVKTIGCKASGLEPSRAARLAGQRRGHVVYDSFTAAQERAPYDVVVASDVIEHVYDTRAFLDSCRELLRPLGILMCLTGDIDCLSARLTGSHWWYVSYPEHIRFPSRRYFCSLPGFRLLETKGTLASKSHQQPLHSRAIELLSAVLRRDYRGQPSLGGDHIIAVLQKMANP